MENGRSGPACRTGENSRDRAKFAIQVPTIKAPKAHVDPCALKPAASRCVKADGWAVEDSVAMRLAGIERRREIIVIISLGSLRVLHNRTAEQP